MLRYKDCILCEKSACSWCGFCIQLMATEGERCDCLYKFRKRQTDLIIFKKILRNKDRTSCEKLVCRWCGLCTQLMATEGEKRERYTNSEKDRQISFSSSPKICCDTRIAYCMRSLCAVGLDSVHSSWRQERDAIVYTKWEKDRQISISSSQNTFPTKTIKYCNTRIAYCAINWCAGGVDSVYSSWQQDKRDAFAI